MNKRITLCACSSRHIIDKEKAAAVASALEAQGYEVKMIADLCKLVETHDTALETISQSIVVACYPRAVAALFASCGLKEPERYDIRNESAEEVLAKIAPDAKEVPVDSFIRKQLDDFPVEEGTDAWFPVMDKSRCINCGKCFDFCLFGVYAKEDREVKVVHPSSCKNNCPACSRICPEKAIIFPKYERSPFNGGLKDDEVIGDSDQAFYTAELRRRLELRKNKVSLLKKEGK